MFFFCEVKMLNKLNFLTLSKIKRVRKTINIKMYRGYRPYGKREV